MQWIIIYTIIKVDSKTLIGYYLDIYYINRKCFNFLKALEIRKSNDKMFTDMIWEWCRKALHHKKKVAKYNSVCKFLSSHAVLFQHYYIINKRAYLKLLVFLFFNVFGICFTVLGICPHTLMLSCFVQNTLKHFDTKFHAPRGW